MIEASVGAGGAVPGYAVVDVETTGLSARSDRIVELAVVQVDEAGRVEDEWVTLLNPCRDLGPQAIHRISAADVLDAPTFGDVAEAVAGLLAGRVFVAHNAAFDRRFVQAELEQVGLAVPDLAPLSVCTMHWSGRLLPVTYRTLAGCCACAGVALEDAHEALADARAAAGLLGVLVGLGQPELPWKDALVAASGAAWPSLGEAPRSAVRTVRRGATADRAHFLARLVATAPPPPSDEEAASYLATLDRALLDRFLSEREQRALVELAADLRIDRPTAEALHRGYLRELAVRALDDGVVTAGEMADLDAVAALLGFGPQDVEEVLAVAADAPPAANASAPRVPAFALAPGDLVVFTGEMRRPREEWEAAAVQAGLVPWSNVTKKVRLVVAADPDSLSTKARKAADYGIPIVGEDAFATMLAGLR